MTDWQEVKLSDVADFVTDKIEAGAVNLDNYISTDNMLVDRGGITKAASLPQASKFNWYVPTDTLFSNIRTYFKKVWLADRAGGVSADVLIFRTKDEKKLNPLYLYYLISGQEFVDFTVLTAKGAKMPRGDKGAIMQFKLHLPSPDEQIDIADSLRCIDQKIELNQRMNETLEGMARAIFKSWFVDFDPVHAKAEGSPPEGMDSATAALFPSTFTPDGLPESWRAGKLQDVLELSYGKSLTKTERIDGDFPVYGSGGINGTHNQFLVEGPGIIIGRKGTVGSIYWENKDFYPIDTVFYVVPKRGFSLGYIYCLLETLGLETMNTDAAVPGLNRNNAYRLEVVIPCPEVVTAYTGITKPLSDKIAQNIKQNQTLATLRDTLLPKLISGELRVDTPCEALKEAVG